MSSVRLSVCLSVTLVDQDHIGWKSWKLITRTLSPPPSLFVAQRPSTYSQGNMGKFGDCPNCLSTPIISGTDKATNFKFGRYIHSVHPNKSRLKIFEKMERGRIQGLPKFYAYPLLSQEQAKLRTSSLAGIFTESMRTKAL